MILTLLAAACAKKPDGAADPLLSDRDLIGPLVTEADAPLREGLWDSSNHEVCIFDTATSGQAWPDCASWWIIANGRVRFGYGPVVPDDQDSGVEFHFRDGEPAVIENADDSLFEFDLAWPLEADDRGRIVALYRRAIDCELDPPNPIVDANVVNAPHPPPAIPGAARDAEGRCLAPDVGVLVSAQAIAGPKPPGEANLRFIRETP